tara:strand:+ start:232 stop:1014 length:783 start_codon:yes stop_codon:yes gene_type:complete
MSLYNQLPDEVKLRILIYALRGRCCPARKHDTVVWATLLLKMMHIDHTERSENDIQLTLACDITLNAVHSLADITLEATKRYIIWCTDTYPEVDSMNQMLKQIYDERQNKLVPISHVLTLKAEENKQECTCSDDGGMFDMCNACMEMAFANIITVGPIMLVQDAKDDITSLFGKHSVHEHLKPVYDTLDTFTTVTLLSGNRIVEGIGFITDSLLPAIQSLQSNVSIEIDSKPEIARIAEIHSSMTKSIAQFNDTMHKFGL